MFVGIQLALALKVPTLATFLVDLQTLMSLRVRLVGQVLQRQMPLTTATFPATECQHQLTGTKTIKTFCCTTCGSFYRTVLQTVLKRIGWQWRIVFTSYVSAPSSILECLRGELLIIKCYTLTLPAVFPPWCGASSEKCLLLWHHFLSKIVWSYWLTELWFTSHSTQNRSFQRRSSQPISWLVLRKQSKLELKMFYQTNHMEAAEITPSSDGMVPSAVAWRYLQPAHSILSLPGVVGVHSVFHPRWPWPLTFDLDIQTRFSNGSHTSSAGIWHKSIEQFPRYLIHKQEKQKSHRQCKKQNLTQYAVYCVRNQEKQPQKYTIDLG